MRLASMWIKQKKNILFFQPNFHFFFEKNAGSSTGKFWMKKWKKTRSKKKCPFCARSLWRVLDVQYYCGTLFRYNYWCPESLEYVRPLHSHYGRPLFQKVPKNGQKSLLGHTIWGKMLLRRGATQKKFWGNKFYMHELQSATRVTRRNTFRPK